MLDNRSIAAIFLELGELLDIQGGEAHRATTFRRVSRKIANLEEPVSLALRNGKLRKMWGVGDGTVRRIKEILTTGTCRDLTEIHKRMPSAVRELLQIEGLGPKSVRALYTHMKIGSVMELEHAVLSGRIKKLPVRLSLSEESLLNAIKHFYNRIGRTPLPIALKIGQATVESLAGPGVEKIELTGSLRRFRETVGDLDILIASAEPKVVAQRFVGLDNVADIVRFGDARASVRIDSGQQIDIRVVHPDFWGAGQHYFTGSKEHNIQVRILGNKKGLKISEHGVFRRDSNRLLTSAEHEREIFAAVDLPWIPPEIRENRGEFELAQKATVPQLLSMPDLKGELCMHSGDSAEATPEAMINRAQELGLSYVCGVNSRTEETQAELQSRKNHLRFLQQQIPGIKILCGVYVDIAADGTLSLPVEQLKDQDFVLAGVNSHYGQTQGDMTRRLIAAMETGVVDCIAHPLNRVFGKREPVAMDYRRVFRAASKWSVAMELNCDPQRLDLSAIYCKSAKSFGVKIAICSHAASPQQYQRRELGVGIARRGWLEPAHVLNSWSISTILSRRQKRMQQCGLQVAEKAADKVGDKVGEQIAEQDLDKPEETDDVQVLIAQLRNMPPQPELRARLEQWFQSGTDPLLEEALKQVFPGQQPLQMAFNLLALAQLQKEKQSPAVQRLEAAKEIFGEKEFSKKQYMEAVQVSSTTAAKDLAAGFLDDRLKKKRRLYCFC